MTTGPALLLGTVSGASQGHLRGARHFRPQSLPAPRVSPQQRLLVPGTIHGLSERPDGAPITGGGPVTPSCSPWSLQTSVAALAMSRGHWGAVPGGGLVAGDCHESDGEEAGL